MFAMIDEKRGPTDLRLLLESTITDGELQDVYDTSEKGERMSAGWYVRFPDKEAL